MEQIKTFISYAHRDDEYFKDFTEKFKVAVKNRKTFEWSVWDDRNIHVGHFWDDEIQKNIHDCDIAVLLISMGFMASNYIKEHEFEAFKTRYAERGVLIIPVLFAPCDFEHWEDLSKIQFFKPKGIDYGRPDKKDDFTYADLVKFKPDGTVLPNPEADRYVLNLVQKIEESFSKFNQQKKQKEIQEKAVANILSTEIINNLNDAPKPRPYFTGREEEIAEFKAAIDGNANLILIDGPGGIGKTQFVSRCIEEFIPTEKIVWYECSQASHLDTLISEAGYPELLKGKSKTDKEKFTAFKEKIQKTELFVFLDNLQDTNENPVFREFIVFIQDHLKQGCVVVIDRDNLKSADLNPKRIHLEGLKDKQLEYAKKLIAYSYQGVQISDNELNDLCEQLQGHPLAIDLAILLISEGETPDNIITKIVQLGDNEKVNERLLNAIFRRPDALPEEQTFITQFSIFTNRVSDAEVNAVIPKELILIARKRLQKKNLLTYSSGYYEIHSLVRELCYQKLNEDEQVAEKLHSKAANYYLTQRADTLSPALEEQIFYHLSRSKQWEKIDKEIDENGRKFILQGQLGLMNELLDRLEKIGINKPIFTIFRGDIAEIQGKWDDALAFYNGARQTGNDKKINIEGLIKYGEILHRKGNVEAALQFYEEAYQLASDNDFLKEKARATNDIGLVHDWYGNTKLAFRHFDEALALRKEINDSEGIADTLVNIASIHGSNEQLENALKILNEALTLYLSIKNQKGIALSISAIAEVFRKQNNLEEAFKYCKNGLRICEAIGDPDGKAAFLNVMGMILEQQNKLDEALKKYEESIKIAEEIGTKIMQAVVLNNSAVALQKQKKYSDAIKFFEQSLTIYEAIHKIDGMATTCYNLALLYLRPSIIDIRLATILLFKSLAIHRKLGRKSKSMEIANTIGSIRDKIGLSQFKEIAHSAHSELNPHLQQHISLKTLLNEPIINASPKTGRNDPCPCGSGKKYKQCHGKNA